MTDGLPSSLTLTMPDWFGGMAADLPDAVGAIEGRMAIVNDLARRNFEHGTGGPFAAGVFERDTGRLVSLGVNRVVPLGITGAHAEFMALSLAQKALRSWDLGAEGLPAHQLVVNWRPCAMCFGSTLWSGVVDLVLAGAGPELESLTGFDEGPIHPAWQEQLAARGISLSMDVGRAEAVEVFRAFGESDALVYNARGGTHR